VHREQLVVPAGGHHLEARVVQLSADDLRERAADEEEHERRHHVADADALVVGRRQPAEQAGGAAPDRFGGRRGGLGRGRVAQHRHR
jgi:hypothetical protein